MTTERWLPVVGYEDGYEISSLGKLWSVLSNRSLSGSRNASGHLTVRLRSNGVSKTLYIHRIVLEAFVGLAPTANECCHNNGNPADNRLVNLRWDTRSNNAKDAIRHGSLPLLRVRKGEEHHLTKFTKEDVLRIREASLFGATQRQLASAYGAAQASINSIVLRKSWSHI